MACFLIFKKFLIPSFLSIKSLTTRAKHKAMLTLSEPSIGYGADKKHRYFEIKISNAKYIRFLVDISSFGRNKVHLF